MRSAEETACEPIKNALIVLNKENIKIHKTEMRDYHFKELEIETNEINAKIKKELRSINGIEQKNEKTFFCTCHWSTINVKS